MVIGIIGYTLRGVEIIISKPTHTIDSMQTVVYPKQYLVDDDVTGYSAAKPIGPKCPRDEAPWSIAPVFACLAVAWDLPTSIQKNQKPGTILSLFITIMYIIYSIYI